MKVLEEQGFPYPGLGGGHGRCDVDVYRLGGEVLVVLRDQDDHGGTSVTNALPAVCLRVHRELLVPEGLAGLSVHWVHWSRADGVASNVFFADRASFGPPEWEYLSPEGFGKILAAFEAPDQLQTWIAEGALDLNTWEETRGEGQVRREKPN